MTTQKTDKIEVLESGGIIQHGKYNDRIYLMKTEENFSPELPAELIKIAQKHKYSKIFAKVPANKIDCFENLDYQNYSIKEY